MMRRPIHGGEIAGLIAGFSAWALAFVVLYGGHGLACSAGPVAPTIARLALVGAWLVMLAVQALLAGWLWRRWRRAAPPVHFLRLVSFALALAAFAATVWTGFPVAVLQLC